jgi:hypothetical protein
MHDIILVCAINHDHWLLYVSQLSVLETAFSMTCFTIDDSSWFIRFMNLYHLKSSHCTIHFPPNNPQCTPTLSSIGLEYRQLQVRSFVNIQKSFGITLRILGWPCWIYNEPIDMLQTSKDHQTLNKHDSLYNSSSHRQYKDQGQ